jgi:pyruvate-formate lyase-activating enzyme
LIEKSMTKVFPIRQGVACQLKWTWNTVRLAEATSACCHRVSPISIDVNNFDNFHNDPTWVSHRRMQLAGEFPQQGCQYCERIEQAGGLSDRLLHQSEPDISPPELDTDPLAVVVTPRVLEVFINNVCNMSCIYCDESNSSKIQQENVKFGYAVPGTDYPVIPIVPKVPEHKDLVNKFFGYLDKNYHSLTRLHVLGGEPFYQREFDRLLDFIEQHPNRDLRFTVISNLMVSTDKIEQFVDRMYAVLARRGLKRVDITASIDCWGAEQEYVRYGLDLEQWQRNFELLSRHKWLHLTVNNTITSLTIKTLPDLLKYINHIRQQRPVHHSFGLVDFRPYLHPGIFGAGYFDKDFQQILDCMPNNTDIDIKNKEYMTGLLKSLNSYSVDCDQQRTLGLYLDEIDRRRNLNWRDVFPWLNKHLKELDHVV